MRMNREIKFRAWNKKHKEFYYSHSKKKEVISEYQKLEIFFKVVQEYKNEFEFPNQFTGLKDKNGKEIYEGDILSPSLREVLWRKGEYGDGDGWYTESHKLKTGYWSLSKTQTENSEIIGNIYENRELLG